MSCSVVLWCLVFSCVALRCVALRYSVSFYSVVSCYSPLCCVVLSCAAPWETYGDLLAPGSRCVPSGGFGASSCRPCVLRSNKPESAPSLGYTKDKNKQKNTKVGESGLFTFPFLSCCYSFFLLRLGTFQDTNKHRKNEL